MAEETENQAAPQAVKAGGVPTAAEAAAASAAADEWAAKELAKAEAEEAAAAAAAAAAPSESPGQADYHSALSDLARAQPHRGHGVLLAALIGGCVGAAILAGFLCLLQLLNARAPINPPPAVAPPPNMGAALAAKDTSSAPSESPDPAVSAGTKGPPSSQPSAVSWQQAERDFASRKFDAAATAYSRLAELTTRETPEDQAVADFLQLRLSQCLLHSAKPERSIRSLRGVAQSRSPILRAIACYTLATIEVATGQPMEARQHAYQAAAAAGFLADPAGLERECDFLVARSLGVKALSLGNSDVTVEWPESDWADAFAGADEAAVRRRLMEGASRLAAGALGPQVRKATDESALSRWDALSAGSGLEEVIARLCGQTRGEVRWMCDHAIAGQRPVTMNCMGVGEQRILELAAGSAGLLARFTGDETRLYDFQSLASVKEQRDLLFEEASAAWRRFFLRHSDDRRNPVGHFVVAAVAEASGDPVGAIGEYQVTVSRFPRDRMAPHALLRSARLRMQLRDFVSAHADLTNLLDNYADSSLGDQAYLSLGQALRESGATDEALRVLQKLSRMEVLPSTRAEACYGVGQCLFAKGDCTEAVQWLRQYLTVCPDLGGQAAVDAYALLGRCEAGQGRHAESVKAFRSAMASGPVGKQRIEISLELAQAQVHHESYPAALATLNGLTDQDLSAPLRSRQLLLIGQAYRGMNLTERAIPVLERGVEALKLSPPHAAAVGRELARCYAQVGEFPAAYESLTAALGAFRGEEAQAASCELAEVCLKLKKTTRAESLCKEVLKGTPPAAIQQRASKALADAYMAQGEYEKAAVAMAAQVRPPTGAKP